ncbi:MAG: transposase [Candidatus Fermentibacteraceae bacterium]|nr:transposase [Candidatus Fermentibacteraceae bacterium]
MPPTIKNDIRSNIFPEKLAFIGGNAYTKSMSRITRVVVPGLPHHITQRGVRSINIFECDKDRYFYLRMLSEYAKKHKLDIKCWCLMCNHIHLIAVPDSEETMSQAIGSAHWAYANSFNERKGVKGRLFQGRYYSTPMSTVHYNAAVRYILRNPVRAGIVRNAWNYEWSSTRFHMGLIEHDPLVRKPDILELHSSWREYLIADPVEMNLIRRRTKNGIPCGEADFVREIERLTNRKFRKNDVNEVSDNKIYIDSYSN